MGEALGDGGGKRDRFLGGELVEASYDGEVVVIRSGGICGVVGYKKVGYGGGYVIWYGSACADTLRGVGVVGAGELEGVRARWCFV